MVAVGAQRKFPTMISYSSVQSPTWATQVIIVGFKIGENTQISFKLFGTMLLANHQL